MVVERATPPCTRCGHRAQTLRAADGLCAACRARQQRERPCLDCGTPTDARPGRCRPCAFAHARRAKVAALFGPEAATAEPLTVACALPECPRRDARITLWPYQLRQWQAGKRFYHSPGPRDGADAPDCSRVVEEAASRRSNAARKTRQLVACASCGKQVEKHRFRLEQSKHVYCSHACANRGLRSARVIRCRLCDRQWNAWPSVLAKVRSYDPETGTYTCRHHGETFNRGGEWLDVRCRSCGKERRVRASYARARRSFDPTTLTFQCKRDHGPVWADQPCRLCGERFRVRPWRRQRAQFCSKEHAARWVSTELVQVELQCGHRRRIPPREVGTRRYCDHRCFAQMTHPVPPSKQGAQAKHARAVARYRAAVDGGAKSLQEIRAASGLSITTVIKLRRAAEEAAGAL